MLNMNSHSPKLILGQSDTWIEVQAQLGVRATLQRSADEIVDSAKWLVDTLLRKRKNNITGIEVGGNSKSHDSLGSLVCPVLEDLGRVIMLPKPILEA